MYVTLEFINLLPLLPTNLGCFPFVRTHQPAIPIVTRIKTDHPHQSDTKYYAQRLIFQQKLLEKAYFIAKMSGPAMVQPASSDIWKAPLVSLSTAIALHLMRTVYSSIFLCGIVQRDTLFP